MFKTLIKKELREQLRTHRLMITLAFFLVIGLISPVLARYTPALLASIPDLPAGLAGIIPEPTVKDAIDQYVKNIGQLGLVLVIVLNMGVIAQERERGTAAMLLTKPAGRKSFILAKWLASVSVVLLGLVLGAVGCYLYTLVLFEALPLAEFLAMNGLLAVFLTVYVSLAILASSLARSQAMAAAGAFGLLALALVFDALPRLGDAMPGELVGWGVTLALGQPDPAWAALAASLGLICLSLGGAALYFERQEI